MLKNDKNVDNGKIAKLKTNYSEVAIPKELDQVVKKAIITGKKETTRSILWFKRGSAVAAAVIVTFGISVNVSPAFATSLAGIPIIGTFAQILNIDSYQAGSEENKWSIDIKTPEIQGLDDKNLENSINQAYLQESKDLYNGFMAEIGNVPANEMANKAVVSGYEVVVNDGQLLVIRSFVDEIAASAKESLRYKTLDVQKQQMLTLPSLFKDDSYIAIISQNIKDQMKQNPDNYFTDDNGGFKQIAADANFFISQDRKLVISFDEYEVAPGFMGVCQFEIPSDLIQDILVSNEYVK